MPRRTGACLRCCLVLLAVVLALCVSGPALYWRLRNGLRFEDSKIMCPPCICDCQPPLSVLKIALDCGSNDPDMKHEMEKHFVDLLKEELKLQETVAEEHIRHLNVTFAEAKRTASQYQREAEKCNAATETCEEARERAEALLLKERKFTSLWQQRARLMGWEGQ